MSVEQEIIKSQMALLEHSHTLEEKREALMNFYVWAFNKGVQNAKENVDDWLTCEQREQLYLECQ